MASLSIHHDSCFKIYFIYLSDGTRSHLCGVWDQALVVVCGILIPLTRIEPKPPALGTCNLATGHQGSPQKKFIHISIILNFVVGPGSEEICSRHC